MSIDRIEFDDPDDPKSGCRPYPMLSVSPEGMALFLPNGSLLRGDDRVAIGQMLRLAYQQGKEIGEQRAAKEKQ